MDLSTQTSSVRREHLLAAAVLRFAQDPFHLVDVESIAREAGMGKGTLYRYFKGKDDLFLAAVEYQLEDALSCVQRVAASEPDAAAYLRAVIHGAVDYFLARPEAFRLVLLAHGSRQPELAAVVEHVRSRHYPAFQERMEAAMRAGALAAHDPQLLLSVLDASIMRLLAQTLESTGARRDVGPTGQRIKAQLVDLLLDGIRPR